MDFEYGNRSVVMSSNHLCYVFILVFNLISEQVVGFMELAFLPVEIILLGWHMTQVSVLLMQTMD